MSFNSSRANSEKAQPRPLLDVPLLGDQIKRVDVILVMGGILRDGKSNGMLCDGVRSFPQTLCLSQATFTPSEVASDTRHLFHWIKTRVIERVTCAAMFDPSNQDRSECLDKLLH